jgi:site-specific DNA-methyltransferase (adenine-specific)
VNPYSDGTVTLYHGKCEDILPSLPAESVDAVVTDPPYGLEFMDRSWDRFDGESIDPAFMHWFAGFVDGEGCFSVHRKPQNTFDCQFSITLRADDRPILERIQRTLGIGTLSMPTAHQNPSSGRADNPKARYCVSSQRDCTRLRDLFRAFPLRAKKAKDFELWSDALDAWLKHKRGEWDDMAQLRDELMQGRAYSEEGIRVDPFQMWCWRWARECFRVLKPGGHLLAFGGTRTWHRLTCGIEDAGFEIRDSIDWVYGQGFPKNKACLKPAHEPIVMARKPTGRSDPLPGLDGCRLSTGDGLGRTRNTALGVMNDDGWQPQRQESDGNPLGRWPANIVFTHSASCEDECAPDCPVAELDRQSGATVSSIGKPRQSAIPGDGYGMTHTGSEYADSGGASRFYPVFRYEAKAPASERPRLPDGTAWPTVKPLDLMRWLVRLVTPPGGTVLDLFAGTGTTAEAAVIEGFSCILIEQDPAAAELIRTRLSKPIQPVMLAVDDSAPPAPARPVAASRPKPVPEAHPSLFDEEAEAS